jgi:hypothetical protein
VEAATGALLLTGIGLVCSAPALAEDPAAAPDASAARSRGWQLSVAPYLWGAGLDGTVSAGRVEADVDVAFSDIFDALDIGALAAFEARRGRLSLTSNLVYLKLSTDADRPIGGVLPPAPPGSLDVDLDSQMLFFEGMAGYEVLSVPLGAADARRLALDLRSGFRTWWLDNEIDVELDPGLPLGPFERSFDESDDWVDLLLGARVSAGLTEKLALVVSGDYGGFDIGSSSHRTWSIAGLVSYRIAEHWELGAGWRTLEIERGIADVEMEGPLIGGRYHF